MVGGAAGCPLRPAGFAAVPELIAAGAGGHLCRSNGDPGPGHDRRSPGADEPFYQARVSVRGLFDPDRLWHQVERVSYAMGGRTADLPVGHGHHQRAEPARQHGRPLSRSGSDCVGLLFPAGGAERADPGGTPGGRAGRLLPGLPGVQLQPGQHLHGRLRQPVAGLPAECPEHEAADSQFPEPELCDRRAGAERADIRHGVRDVAAME